MTGRSKGYAFVQYKRAEDAKMALDQMEGFELAGRTVGLDRTTLTLLTDMYSSSATCQYSARERNGAIHSAGHSG
jgi:RNA recognition motif-containing protein